MNEAMFLAAILMMVSGCAFLALGQDRHRKAVTGNNSAYPLIVARIAAIGCLTSAALILWAVEGAFAVLVWPLLFSLCAFTVAAILTWYPTRLLIFVEMIRRRRKPD